MAKAPKTLFTASDMARFCSVDLKTIHNWCDRGQVEHFRTPGRHLRFTPAATRAFLEHFKYPMPAEVTQLTPAAAPAPAAE